MNKLASFSRYAFIPLFLIFLLVSCHSVQPLPVAELSPTYTAVATTPPTHTPTLTPQNTPLPTLTLTSTPTPTGPSLRPTVSLPLPSLTPFPTVTPDYLVYPTKPVFISYGVYGGDGGEDTGYYYGRSTPNLIIYSDGHIVIQDGMYQESITFWEAFLTPAEMCNLLQQIEATGFLQEHEIFFTERTGGEGASELIIEVEDAVYSFYGPDTLYLIEELANGSQLIRNYRPAQALAPYAPLYLALWIEQEAPDEDETLFSWPSNLPTLAALWSMRGTPDTVFANAVIVEGEWVTPIFDLFSRQLSRKVFQEGDITYSLIARPLLPHETPRTRIGHHPTYPTHYAPAVACDNEPSLISPAIPTATPTLTASANQLTGQGRILFVSGERRPRDIYVIDANGNNRLRLTNNLFLDEEPAWSPDGRQIAFTSNRDGGGRNIFVMDVDGTNIRQLTDTLRDNYSPGWSPDGQQIVFVSDRDKGWQEAEIYLMNADGTEQRRLTQSRNRYLSPVWSPDGRKIFVLKELAYMNLRPAILYFHEGEWIERQLSGFSTNFPIRVAWSPDSSQIAIPWSPTPSEATIRIVNLDGSEAQSFDITPLESAFLNWSADGSYILFSGRDSSDRERIAHQSGDYYDGNWGIYALDTFSGEVIQITFGTQDEFSPAWWP